MQFMGRIRKEAGRTTLRLPFDPDAVWGERSCHYVSGTIGGHAFRGTVERDSEGSYLSIGPAWLRDNPVPIEADIEVVLAPEGPQVATMEEDIAAALRAEPEALRFFEGLPTFYRNNYMRWVGQAKRAETRARRIAEMVRLLKAGVRDRQ